jgi:hypothetical protein
MNDMTKVKDITFIGAYKNLASDDYCDRMIKAFNNLEETSSAWSGSDANGLGNRKDYSYRFDMPHNDTLKTDLYASSLELAKETNKFLDSGLLKYVDDYPSLENLRSYSRTVKVQRTPPKGGFHRWHAEQGADEEAGRMLVWTIYLNDVPDGEGETEFLEYGIKVKPKKGTVCFFPASFTHTHRGNAVYTHDKYIATGWYYLA